MKRFEFKTRFVGPSGDEELWTVCAAPTIAEHGRRRRFLAGDCGHTDWINRVLTINSRLRSPVNIRDTLLHEIVHVTSGQNGSEWLATNVEGNHRNALEQLCEILTETTR